MKHACLSALSAGYFQQDCPQRHELGTYSSRKFLASHLISRVMRPDTLASILLNAVQPSACSLLPLQIKQSGIRIKPYGVCTEKLCTYSRSKWVRPDIQARPYSSTIKPSHPAEFPLDSSVR